MGLSVPDIQAGNHVRSRAKVIQRKTGNLRAVQILIEHEIIDSTVKYLDVEVEGVIVLSESIDL